MNNIIYPTLDLFLYDLRNSADETEEQIQKNREYFQKKLPPSVYSILFRFDQDFEVEYIELLAKPRTQKFADHGEPYPIEGYYYPVRLGDTYGLLVDCSVNNQTEPQPVECFATLKTEILTKKLDDQIPTIGKSWMISGILPNGDPTEIETIAKGCYHSLMPELNWEEDLQGKGEFLGAKIFELSHYRLKITEDTTLLTNIEDIQQNEQVIIILYPDEATARIAAKFYTDWMRLFYYRHKVLWCYGQSRVLKQSLKKHLSTIQNGIKYFNQNHQHGLELKEISKTLKQVQETLNPYTIELTYLDFQIRAIEINLGNYIKRCSHIEQKSGGTSEIEFLAEFSDLAKDKYLLQITKDYDNLKLGLNLLDSSINMLRSRVEVDDAERDRIFQTAVAIIGVGFSASSLIGSIPEGGVGYSDPVRYLLVHYLQVPSPWLNSVTELVYNLAVALVAGALTWLVIKLWPRSR